MPQQQCLGTAVRHDTYCARDQAQQQYTALFLLQQRNTQQMHRCHTALLHTNNNVANIHAASRGPHSSRFSAPPAHAHEPAKDCAVRVLLTKLKKRILYTLTLTLTLSCIRAIYAHALLVENVPACARLFLRVSVRIPAHISCEKAVGAE